MTKFLERNKIRELIVLLIIIVPMSFSIIYANIQAYDPILTPETGYKDTTEYIKVYKGEQVDRVRSLRILVPFLVRGLPDLPESLFSSNNRLLGSPDLKIAMKFAIINLFFLICTCLALYVLGRGFNFGYSEGLLSSILFLGSQTVVRSSGLPTTDTAFLFFFVLCLVAIQLNKKWLLLTAFAIGILTKELLFITILAVLLTSLNWRQRFVLLLCLIPGTAIFLMLLCKMGISPVKEQLALTAVPHSYTNLINTLRINLEWLFSSIANSICSGFHLNMNKIIKIFLSFNLIWIPAIFTIINRSAPLLLRRWSWLIAIIIIGALFYGNLDRLIFNAFPIVIPLAVLGLSKWLIRVPNCKLENE